MASDALVTSGLTRRFGRRVAVDDLSISVQVGDVYGFLGPNGAGKTTAIRCIMGLLIADAGEVSVFGEASPVARRRDVGALVETPAFHLGLSARANLMISAAYGGIECGSEIDSVLERVGLGARKADRVGSYSLGMCQRLGIARALLGRPKLLILDEPTNGLDPRGMREVRDLLIDLSRRDGLTIFVSSHLLGEVEQMCNRVGIIENGRLVSEGPLDATAAKSTSVQEVDVGVDPTKLAAVLADLPGVRVVGDGEAGRLRLALDEGTVSDLVHGLVGAGLSVEAVVPVQARLEDHYLAITSKDIT